MTHSPDIVKKDVEHLKAFVVGAAPVGLALITKLLDKFGHHIFFQEGFGMTELSPVSHLIRVSTRNKKFTSVGSVIAETQCKVIDISTGKALGPDQQGEICVKGPQMMKGYYKNEEATKETIDSEGWLHTGDIGYYDDEENFYIVDRLKELIKVKGLQVAPAELEDILRKHPGVADVAVIGVPDIRSGEAPRAYIVRKEGSKPVTKTKLHTYMQRKVANYKLLRGGIEFVAAIPKAVSGKILRRELKADYLKKKRP